MGRFLESKEVRYGRNADNAFPQDSHYVRCGRCGFMCNTDRDVRAPWGSRLGMGITHPEIVAYDGGPDSTPVEYDGADSEERLVSYDGYRTDFNVVGGCPFCGAYTYDKEEYRSSHQ